MAIAYFITREPVDYTTSVRYRGVTYSIDDPTTPIYSNWATITIVVTVNGCDGIGGVLDHCGVCNGNGHCAPFGCDGLGSTLDECGVCNGTNESCQCSVANWRGFSTETLDKSIFYYDLRHLNDTISSADATIAGVTDLLLAGEGGYDELTCLQYSDALARVRMLQAKTVTYNAMFLAPFLERMGTTAS